MAVQVPVGLEQAVTPPTIEASAAAGRTWDPIVIGAGPAGSLAAKQIAAAGASVLLVDRARFPRDKVCGCCLNAAALQVLDRCGEATVVGEGPRLRELHLHAGRDRAAVPLAAGAAVSRSLLDSRLVHAATAAGASFLPGISAHVCAQTGRVLLGAGEVVALDARAVIAADGVGGSALRDIASLSPSISRRSRIGLGTIARSSAVPRGRVVMSVGRRGYVGMVRLDHPGDPEPLLDIAAAIDPAFVRSCGSPAAAVESICNDAGIAAPTSLQQRRFTGTVALIRRRAVEHEHIYVVGDAAGYVEPFTGEGIAWALEGAEALAPIVLGGLAGRRRVGEWSARHRQLIGRRQLACRAVAAALRSPRAVALGMAACAAAPRLAERVIASIHRETGLPA